MSRTLPALAVAILLAFVPAASGDELIIEKLAAAPAEMPGRGMTMDRVRNGFGAPQGVMGPIGEPPITRWDYADFVVVFEHSHVVHSVAKPGRAPRSGS
jgi:hypothetical protein